MQHLLGASNLTELSSYFPVQFFDTSSFYPWIPVQSEIKFIDKCFKTAMSSGARVWYENGKKTNLIHRVVANMNKVH